MDNDRKYRQNGYMDTDRDSSKSFRGDDRPKPQGPRLPIDVTGPRLPRLVQHVAASRCFNCATTLPPGTEMTGNCPKCNAELHCCKQCSHFEPGSPRRSWPRQMMLPSQFAIFGHKEEMDRSSAIAPIGP